MSARSQKDISDHCFFTGAFKLKHTHTHTNISSLQTWEQILTLFLVQATNDNAKTDYTNIVVGSQHIL